MVVKASRPSVVRGHLAHALLIKNSSGHPLKFVRFLLVVIARSGRWCNSTGLGEGLHGSRQVFVIGDHFVIESLYGGIRGLPFCDLAETNLVLIRLRSGGKDFL